MPRRVKLRPPNKRGPTGPLRQSRSQLLSDGTCGLVDQSRTHIPLNNSSASTIRSFLSTDTTSIASAASTNNPNITKPIDGISVEPTQMNQAVLVAETPVQLEVDLTDTNGTTTVERLRA